jgi:hypothetical protein
MGVKGIAQQLNEIERYTSKGRLVDAPMDINSVADFDLGAIN